MIMTTEITENNRRDELLWRAAKRRVNFRHHLITYILVNSFLWALWFVGGGFRFNGFPWPVWPTLGWGIGLAMDYIHSYVIPMEGKDKRHQIETEYQKLKQQNKY